MILIEEKIISDAIVEEQFLCNLDACKGACCWEGDAGAPLEAPEVDELDRIYPTVKSHLSPAGQAAIQQQGRYTYDEEDDVFRTPLIDNGPCAYMTLDAQGKAQCGIEKAWQKGEVSFRKPISCHLYPIRITEHPSTGMEALNYERWDICSAACAKGAAAQLPVYRFAKAALIRKYGTEFYDALDQYAQQELTE
ncbi:MAG: DUF3109 family protein [Bacteroidota bacterium]